MKKSKFIAMILSVMMIFSVMFSISMISADAATTLSATGATEIANILKSPVEGYKTNTTKGTKVTNQTTTLNTLYYYRSSDGAAVGYALFTQNGNTFKFNATQFEQSESSLQQAALSTFVRKVNSTNKISNSDKNKIYDEIKNNCSGATAAMIGVIFEDNKADLFSALKIFSPFGSVFGSILGIGVIVIIVLLLGSTVFDLVYLGVPVARNYLTDKQDQKGGGKPWGITNEAWTVINEVEGGNGSSSNGKYRNAYILYFKRRIITYIVLAICILYLLSGQIAGLISWLMSLVSGFSL